MAMVAMVAMVAIVAMVAGGMQGSKFSSVSLSISSGPLQSCDTISRSASESENVTMMTIKTVTMFGLLMIMTITTMIGRRMRLVVMIKFRRNRCQTSCQSVPQAPLTAGLYS